MNTVLCNGLAAMIADDIGRMGFYAAIRKYKNQGYSFEQVLLATRIAYSWGV